jgi:hypothetical protein
MKYVNLYKLTRFLPTYLKYASSSEILYYPNNFNNLIISLIECLYYDNMYKCQNIS